MTRHAFEIAPPTFWPSIMSSLVYPTDWEDEDRMHYLVSPLPSSSALSLSLEEQKVQFWSSLVRRVCRASRLPVFSGREMAERYRVFLVSQC